MRPGSKVGKVIADCKVQNETVSKIDAGLVVLLGICKSDTEKDVDYIIPRLLKANLWSGDGKSWKKSVVDISGELLIVSQYTVYAVVGKSMDIKTV